MKNNKGITLTSLIIYITILFVVLATLMRIVARFRDNMSEAADVTFEVEFEKFNLYFLEETKKIGNGIQEILENTEVIFTNGNKYSYNKANKTIYLNDSIKICEGVEACSFTQSIAENGKTIIIVTIKINNIEKTVEYVVVGGMKDNIIKEEDYIWNMQGITNEISNATA